MVIGLTLYFYSVHAIRFHCLLDCNKCIVFGQSERLWNLSHMVEGGICFWMRGDLCGYPFSIFIRLKSEANKTDINGWMLSKSGVKTYTNWWMPNVFRWVYSYLSLNSLEIFELSILGRWTDIKFRNHASRTYLTPIWQNYRHLCASWELGVSGPYL